jgi:hypothetical protein
MAHQFCRGDRAALMSSVVLGGEGAAHPDVALPLEVQESEIRISQSDAVADRFNVKRLHVVLTRIQRMLEFSEPGRSGSPPHVVRRKL